MKYMDSINASDGPPIGYSAGKAIKITKNESINGETIVTNDF